MKNPLVVFSGMDGAGKSTQIEQLVSKWRAEGRRPVRIWARGGYTPGMEWLKRTARRLLGRKVVPGPGPSAQRTQALSRSPVRRWWLRLAILDLMLLYGLAIRWWRLCGRPVICDRYWHDTELDFSLNFPQENVRNWRLWRFLRWVAPQPSYAFLMLIPVEESLRRSAEKNEPFPDSPEVLTMRYNAYRDWTFDEKWIVLDGRQSRDAVAHQIAIQLGLESLAVGASSSGESFV
jgi:dTMP kinase